eukprot:11240592-Alexandrium_andersonii.AAC.1
MLVNLVLGVDAGKLELCGMVQRGGCSGPACPLVELARHDVCELATATQSAALQHVVDSAGAEHAEECRWA